MDLSICRERGEARGERGEAAKAKGGWGREQRGETGEARGGRALSPVMSDE